MVVVVIIVAVVAVGLLLAWRRASRVARDGLLLHRGLDAVYEGVGATPTIDPAIVIPCERVVFLSSRLGVLEIGEDQALFMAGRRRVELPGTASGHWFAVRPPIGDQRGALLIVRDPDRGSRRFSIRAQYGELVPGEWLVDD